MNNIAEYSAVMTTIYREQIEAGEIKFVIEFLESLGLFDPSCADVETLRQLHSRIGLFVDGYNDDSRELFQIPEVRSFFQSLHKVWPYGLYFFSREANTLQLLVLCHVASKVESQVGESMLRVPKDQVIEFIKAAAPANLDIAERIGWTPAIAAQFLGEIGVLFGAARNPAPSMPAPDSVDERRLRHNAFIKSQNETLAEFARSGYQDEGRGCIMVFPPEPGDTGSRVMFINQAGLLEGGQSPQVAQLVARYNPDIQYVVTIHEPEASHSSSYIVKIP